MLETAQNSYVLCLLGTAQHKEVRVVCFSSGGTRSHHVDGRSVLAYGLDTGVLPLTGPIRGNAHRRTALFRRRSL
jgi:hypothetical protein